MWVCLTRPAPSPAASLNLCGASACTAIVLISTTTGELLRIIAACERLSTHPIAKSICLAFGQFADDCVVTDAKNYAGMGVSAVVDGVRYYAGNEKLMQKIGVPFTETQLVGTAVYCCTDTEFLGDIVFADIIKRTAGRPLTGCTVWV